MNISLPVGSNTRKKSITFMFIEKCSKLGKNWLKSLLQIINNQV